MLDIEHLFESCSDLDSIKAPGQLFLMEQFSRALGHSVKTMWEQREREMGRIRGVGELRSAHAQCVFTLFPNWQQENAEP